MKKMRKKGALIIEFIVVLPVFMLLVWGITQIMLYTLAANTINEAAVEAAGVLASEMRGNDKAFPSATLNAGAVKEISAKLENKVQTSVSHNRLIMLFEDDQGKLCSDKDRSACPKIVLKDKIDAGCSTEIKDNRRVICAYVSEKKAGDRDHQQIVVEIRSKFKVVGGFIPGIQEIMNLKGTGISQKELADRYQYYQNSSGTP